MQDTEKKFYPIKGFEDYYEITRCGIIKSKDRIIKVNGKSDFIRRGRILTSFYDGYNRQSGYMCLKIKLPNDKKQKIYLHKMLAITFLSNLNNYRCVNHIDGNKLNNDLSNLEFCDHAHNNKHKYSIPGYINTSRKINSKGVIDIYLNATRGRINGTATYYARKYDVQSTVVYKIIDNKTYKNITKNLKRKGEKDNGNQQSIF